MVSIVIVSHSPSLARGVLELATQMTQGKIKIAIAAGIDDIDNPIGTDAMAIMQAIEEVYCPSGVLLMVDMGSAILSAEMALELIEPDNADNVHICAAPIVEGAMSAAVAAASGLAIEAVIHEAHSALQAKYELLNQTELLTDRAEKVRTAAAPNTEGSIFFSWKVKNPHGIHARPCAAIVAAIAHFDADAKLYCGNKSANAKSLNSIALLGVKLDDTITLTAEGVDANALIKQFSILAETHFGESIDTQHSTHSESELQTSLMSEASHYLSGVIICEGKATGAAHFFHQQMPLLTERAFTSYEMEVQRLNEAITQVTRQIQQLKQLPYAGEEMINIFDAHIMMLTDDDLINDITALIAKQQSAETSVLQAMSGLAKEFQETSSSYMQAREADVWDIARQLLYILCEGKNAPEPTITEPLIVFSEELSPSNTAKLDPALTLAICLKSGVVNSHSAVLAKAMNIPALFQVDGCLQKVEQGQRVSVDAFKGTLFYG